MTHCHLFVTGLINRLLKNPCKYKKSQSLAGGHVLQISLSKGSSHKALMCSTKPPESFHVSRGVFETDFRVDVTSGEQELNNSSSASNGWEMSFQETSQCGIGFHSQLWLWQENNLTGEQLSSTIFTCTGFHSKIKALRLCGLRVLERMINKQT